MEKEQLYFTLILVLVIVLAGAITYYEILPKYKDKIQNQALEDIAYTQVDQGILFFPAVQASDNTTIIQSTSWENLCKDIKGG